jgi:hypothetical protein
MSAWFSIHRSGESRSLMRMLSLLIFLIAFCLCFGLIPTMKLFTAVVILALDVPEHYALLRSV